MRQVQSTVANLGHLFPSLICQFSHYSIKLEIGLVAGPDRRSSFLSSQARLRFTRNDRARIQVNSESLPLSLSSVDVEFV